jgi:hypothetical protein
LGLVDFLSIHLSLALVFVPVSIPFMTAMAFIRSIFLILIAWVWLSYTFPYFSQKNLPILPPHNTSITVAKAPLTP